MGMTQFRKLHAMPNHQPDLMEMSPLEIQHLFRTR